MRKIIRTTQGWGLITEAGTHVLTHPLSDLLRGVPLETTEQVLGGEILAPVDTQEIWASGVTYERSLEARAEESHEPDIYDRVYLADRPELFFKATAQRALGPGSLACIRSDSTWDVPEPEVALVLDANGKIFGYTIGDDLSSRSIEGENPLYLPQAKIYEGSCVLGPSILLADDATPPFDITLTITRANAKLFTATTSTSKMHREFSDLARFLTCALRFETGVVLMTGTGIVPDSDMTLHEGDEVEIAVEQIGTLTHGVNTWNC